MPVPDEKNSELKAAREALEASERRYRELVDLAPIGIFRSTRGGRFVSVNPALASLLGYDSPDEMLQLDMRGDVYFDGAERDRRMSEVESTGRSGFEVRWKRRDGSLVWVLLDSRVIRGASGAIELFEGFVHDIQTRKDAEESLRESEQRHRTLFESMLHGYAYCEMLYEDGKPRDFVYLDVNKAFEELTGLKDVVGKRVTEVIPGIRESSPELFQAYGRVALTGIPERFEIHVESLGIWFSISAYSPQKGRFVALFDNVTERKRAEEALRQSEERFRRSFSSSPVAMTLSEAKTGLMIDVNERLAGMLGYAREELIGRSSLELGLWVDPAERARAVADVEASIPIREREIRLRTKTGEVRYVLDSIEPLRFGLERVLLSAFQDVTERRLLEEQLRQSQKMEAIGQLAGGIAHDFNNVLTAILGYGSLLATRLAGDASGREEVEEILQAAGRAAALTRQLLAFSRRQVLEPVVLGLNELIRNLEKMLGRVIGEHLSLDTRLDPSLGNVLADAGQIEQVIMNLVVNARDAMPQGGRLTIETANADLDEAYAQRHVPVRPGRYVMVAVSDTGVGIDAETQARIFEPFFTTKEKGKGTGLGLSTVYGIVKQSGGYIWVYSEPSKGTTFKVYLPRVDEPLPRRSSRTWPAVTAGGHETILVVEDESAIRSLTRQILEKYGYRVLDAPNGSEAEKLVAGHPEKIDVLLTDLVMPEMPGTELAARLVAKRPGVRVVFMSGYTSDAVVRGGLIESGQAFLQKPFTPTSLARKIRDVLA